MALEKDDILALIAILQKGLEDDNSVPEETVEVAPKKKNTVATAKKSIKTRNRSKVKMEKNVNKFEKRQEFGLHKEDSTIDQQLSKHPPVARIRENVEQVSVSCRICGRKEKVNPSLIFEGKNRYKCNRCSTQAG